MSSDHAGGHPDEYGAGSVPPPPPAGPGVYAGVGERIGARLLDLVIVFLPAAFLFLLLGLGAAILGFGGWWSRGAMLTLLWFGYFVWLESTQGGTIGKKALGLRVVTADGGTPPVDAAAKRNLWMLLGLLPAGNLLQLVAVVAILVTMSSNATNRGFHDEFAGTAVVR